MKINVYPNSLKRYYIRSCGQYVYLNSVDNTINDERPEFGRELHAAALREIEDRELAGRKIADYKKAFTPFIGEIFGGTTKRSKNKRLIAVYRESVVVANVGDGDNPKSMSHYKFNDWVQRDSTKILR